MHTTLRANLTPGRAIRAVLQQHAKCMLQQEDKVSIFELGVQGVVWRMQP